MVTLIVTQDENLNVNFPGFAANRKRRWDQAFLEVDRQRGQDVPPLPHKKIFRSRFCLPLLKRYDVEPDNSYWDKWPKIGYDGAQDIKTSIKADVLERLANESGYLCTDLLRKIISDIRDGASLGVTQGSDVPSDSTNAPSAYSAGAHISDAICKMIKDGFVMGPFDEENLPFRENRFSGIMSKMKPDGTARMILNLSRGTPHSVNSGIDKEEYPTLMSSTEEFVRVLFRCGRNAEMTKCDWKSVDRSEYFMVSLMIVMFENFILNKCFIINLTVFGRSLSAEKDKYTPLEIFTFL